MPAGTVVLLCDPERIRTRAHDLVRTSEEFREASWAAAAVGGEAPLDLGRSPSVPSLRSAPPWRTPGRLVELAPFGWWTPRPAGRRRPPMSR